MEPRALMLALFLVRVCGACTSGFPALETVTDTAAGGEIPPLIMDNVRVWLFPSMIFNWTGNVTKWIFQAVDSGSGTTLPQMQVWRENSVTPLAEDYVLQSSSGTEDELRVIGDSVYEYVLTSPVAVSEGDVFGVLLPESTDRELLLQFQDFGLTGAPLSYIAPFNAAFLATEVAQVAPNIRYLPLVTAVLDVSPETTAASSLSPSTSPVAFPPASSTSAPQVPTSPSPPPHTLSPPVVVDETDSPGSDSNSVAIIIGVVAAVILLITLILIVAILTVVCFRLRSKSLQEEAELRDNPAYGAAISTGPALEENPAYGAAISTGPALEENPAYGAAISTGPALEENPAYGAAISTWPGLEKNPAYGAFELNERDHRDLTDPDEEYETVDDQQYVDVT